MSDEEQIKDLIDWAKEQTSMMAQVVKSIDKLDRRMKTLENKIASIS